MAPSRTTLPNDTAMNGHTLGHAQLHDGLPQAEFVDGRVVGNAFKSKKLRIVMAGAGISGIQLAHDVTTRLQDYEFDIYEKNAGLGGTWYENRYPGCACDVPSHTYQFAWAPNPSWSQFFSSSAEICTYLNRVVDQHNLRKYMHFNHRIASATWLEETSTWKITVETRDADGQVKTVTKECDVFIQGVGALNAWKYPEIEGIQQFKGNLMHTAAWQPDIDILGKKVAVIGNGASAIQCVAALQPAVDKLYNYMRTATWMLPHTFSGGAVQKNYPPEVIAKFESDPELYYSHRKELELTLGRGFEALWRGGLASRMLKSAVVKHMQSTIHDREMLEKLTPDFEVGCRRFTPGDHYLHALQQDNVSMISDDIVRITETGIEDRTGTIHDVDIIVCATGFDVSFEPRFPVLGRDGHSLAENWGKDKPTESYMGSAVAHMPNFFAFGAPIHPVAGSFYPGVAATSDYIIRILDRLQHDCLKSIVVKESAQTEFNEWVQVQMQTLVFSGTCKSWYKNSKGKVYVPWPGTILHYIQSVETIRWEDFDFCWEKKNKYASLGNGAPVEGFALSPPPWLKGSNDLKTRL
ncbi:hypothetical protein IFR05_012979 [Cadophora sp. M221]|nr:hypothetical protein IFR05_012979 [Cadophora sp. M221]